jgi:hypothetical protein
MLQKGQCRQCKSSRGTTGTQFLSISAELGEHKDEKNALSITRLPIYSSTKSYSNF